MPSSAMQSAFLASSTPVVRKTWLTRVAVTRVHRGHYFQGHVEEMFRKHIVPLYGGQARALSSALQGSDRTCQALVDLDAYSHHNEPVGIVVHKNNGTDEFRAFGLTNSFEIKTLVLADPANHSNKGYGGYLLSLAADAARVAGCRTMHVTVSSTTESAMRFFMRRGFTKKHLWTDRYVTGVTEHLLARPTPEVGLDGTYNWDDNPHEHQTALALTHPAPAQARGTDERLDKKRGRESFEDPHRDIKVRRSASDRPQVALAPLRIPLKQPYLTQIRQGLKTVEGRINSGQFRGIQAGQQIVFWGNGGQTEVRTIVSKIQTFRTFHEMLRATGVTACLPEFRERDIEKAVKLYHSLPAFEERARRSGVVALHLELCK